MKDPKIREAIKILKVNKVISASQTAFCEAADIAIDAMEKQIPQAVEKTDDFPQCPNCGSQHIYYAEEEYRHNFCPYCGQRLKW